MKLLKLKTIEDSLIWISKIYYIRQEITIRRLEAYIKFPKELSFMKLFNVHSVQ